MSFFKNKNFIYLILIIALGLIAWGFMRGTSLEEQAAFPKLKFSAKVDRLEIQEPGQAKSILVKKDKVWQVQDRAGQLSPSDTAAVDEIIKYLADFPYKEIVSQNQAKYPDFELTPEQSLSVAWFQGDKKQGQLFFGKSDWQRAGDYVRINDLGTVYLTTGNIKMAFAKPDWRDLTLWKFDPAKVTEVSWNYGDTNLPFALKFMSAASVAGELEGGTAATGAASLKWFIEEETGYEEADQAVAQNFIGTLAAAAGTTVQPTDSARDYGFAKPTFVLTVTADAQQYQLTVGKQADEMPAYYTALPSKPNQVYLVHVALVNDQLMKKAADFKVAGN